MDRVLERTNQFKRDFKRTLKRKKDQNKLKKIITKLLNQEALPASLKDHALIGQYKGSRECHIEPDWLLIYTNEKNILRLERTGSHSDLFE